MVRPPLRLTICPLLLAVAACGGDSDKAGLASATIDTLANGVIEVTNHGPTLWVGDSGWSFDEIATIKPPEGSPGELGEIQGIAGDAAGNVYVMQRGPMVIKAYGPDGNWTHNIGREGDGPGEFRDGMLGLVGDTLVIQDPNNTRMTTFLTDGTFLATYPSRCCYFTSRGLTTFANGTVGILGPPADSGSQSGAYYMTDMSGVAHDTVSLPPREDDPEGAWTVTLTSGKSRSMMSMSIPGHAQDRAVWRSDGMRVGGNTDAYTLVLTRGFTDTTRIIHADAPRLKFTNHQRDSLYDDALAHVGKQWQDAIKEQAKRSDISEDRPLWSNIAVDPENRIWVGLPDSTSDVANLDVFGPDGVLLGQVHAPNPDILGGYFVGDRVLVQDEDDVGLPIIRVYRLDTHGLKPGLGDAR